MTDKELIKQEIERLKEHTAKCGYPGQGEFENGNREGRNWVCDKLLSFIDNLPEEPVSEDLEKAAYEYAIEWSFGRESEIDFEHVFEYVNDAFKAGAEWQKERDYLQYSHIRLKDIKDAWQTLKKNKPDIESYPPICFVKGAEWQKQQNQESSCEAETNCTPENDDLEEAAEAFYDNCHIAKSSWWDEGVLHKMSESKETFIAGAEWYKQQMKETLQTEYEKGRFDMREEMMKNTVLETKVMMDSDGDGIETPYEEWLTLENTEILSLHDNLGLKDGDRVKILIVKDD